MLPILEYKSKLSISNRFPEYKLFQKNIFKALPSDFLKIIYGVNLSGPRNKNIASLIVELNNINVSLSIPSPKPP